MKLKMHENSLFAILLRKPWWVSGLVALAVFGVIRFFARWDFSLLVAMPFIGIALWVAAKQLRAPGARRIAGTVERLRAMSWDEFASTLEAAYQREGYRVTRLDAASADFEVVQGARSTLIACKRWKAMRTGIEPLRELEAARHAREAHACIYIAIGEITEQAQAFAAEKRINFLQGAELATLLR
jgi:restriction system protein